jgi:lipopolysaccharide/colanic/teichoic acid biosynthesis glycosyltransferase
MAKRAYDLVLSGLGLLVIWPLLLVLGVIIRLADGSPVLFRQTRVGRQGRPFQILKLRTMRPNAEHAGASVTQAGDPRVTPVGRWLRKTKLDELPQLWNVFTGDMSLVGPRPEVPQYVARYNAEQQRVLELKPGLTDLATLLYLNEEELLRGRPDVERVYLEEVMPRKIQLTLAYAAGANLWEDTKVILRTLVPGLRLKIHAEEIPAVNPPTVVQSIVS